MNDRLVLYVCASDISPDHEQILTTGDDLVKQFSLLPGEHADLAQYRLRLAGMYTKADLSIQRSIIENNNSPSLGA